MRRQVFDSFDVSIAALVWAHDSKKVIITADHGARERVFLAPLDRLGCQRLLLHDQTRFLYFAVNQNASSLIISTRMVYSGHHDDLTIAVLCVFGFD